MLLCVWVAGLAWDLSISMEYLLPALTGEECAFYGRLRALIASPLTQVLSCFWVLRERDNRRLRGGWEQLHVHWINYRISTSQDTCSRRCCEAGIGYLAFCSDRHFCIKVHD